MNLYHAVALALCYFPFFFFQWQTAGFQILYSRWIPAISTTSILCTCTFSYAYEHTKNTWYCFTPPFRYLSWMAPLNVVKFLEMWSTLDELKKKTYILCTNSVTPQSTPTPFFLSLSEEHISHIHSILSQQYLKKKQKKKDNTAEIMTTEVSSSFPFLPVTYIFPVTTITLLLRLGVWKKTHHLYRSLF